MSDPFNLRGTGPALVSFSGGKTSGYMTRRILDHGLDDDQDVLDEADRIARLPNMARGLMAPMAR